MTGHSERITPEEAQRRKRALATLTALATRNGFRTVAGRPGCFYHPDIGQEVVFDMKHTMEWPPSSNAVSTGSDLIALAYYLGVQNGQGIARRKVREALGI